MNFFMTVVDERVKPHSALMDWQHLAAVLGTVRIESGAGWLQCRPDDLGSPAWPVALDVGSGA